MSFSNPYAGYQNAPGGDTAHEYNRLSNTVSSNVQKISQNVNSMQRMVNQLGTPSDSENLRDQLQQIQHYTNQLARETNNSIKELSAIPQPQSISEQRQRRMLKERLTNDFSDVLKNFQVIQRTAVQKQKESVHRARANSGLKTGPFEEASQNQNLIDLASPGSVGQIQSVIQMEEEVDLETMREREQAIRKLESDILGVNQIFKDLATLVHEQGEVLDSIEANVENATSHIEEGVQQIVKAREYQTKARRKKLLIILILAIVLVIFITIIWTSLK
ncbi:syntaxin-12 [Tetranychus urticae]|uniref:t-SNARE coiled-coil homology domain-containing protein n=1 Tax=Tetranychus urticae TaxID=32264 RepID=T1KRS8_TETUR|nr:syntaxin-12 [Tetranychus urticae]